MVPTSRSDSPTCPNRNVYLSWRDCVTWIVKFHVGFGWCRRWDLPRSSGIVRFILKPTLSVFDSAIVAMAFNLVSRLPCLAPSPAARPHFWIHPATRRRRAARVVASYAADAASFSSDSINPKVAHSSICFPCFPCFPYFPFCTKFLHNRHADCGKFCCQCLAAK